MHSIDEIFNQAVQFHQNGHTQQAERLYRKVLSQNAYHLAAHTNLGVCLIQQGRPEEAIASYQTALRIDPKHLDAQFNLGNAYRRIGRFAEAVGCYQAVLRQVPYHSSSAHNMGLCYSALGMWPQAIQAQLQAIKIEPNFVDAYSHLADTYQKSGKINEAIQAFTEAVRLQPNDPRGYHNLALVLAQKGDMEVALKNLETALKINPNYPEAHNSLGVVLEGLNRSEEAFEHYQRAVALKPMFPDALNNLGTACTELGMHDEAIQYRRISLNLQPHAPHIHSNLLLTMHYSGKIDPTQLKMEHEHWVSCHAADFIPTIPPRPKKPDPERRLNIGYVSGDFRAHTVASFLEPLIQHHNREQFHISCFSNVALLDDVSKRFQELADRWHSIYSIPDNQAVDLIRKENIDILVDCSGHTAGNRLLVFARKPATIQATVFGYPNTTGLPTIDYRITDPLSDPEGKTESFYVEKLWRLPDIAWCYLAPSNAPPVGPLPADQNGYITFGSLNNLAKLTPEILLLWCDLLKQVPNSHFILLAGKGGFGKDRVLQMIVHQGIASDRIEIFPRLAPDKYLELHNRIDLYLDPFPYNGGVTSCDALWMGTPMITLSGNHYYSRQGLGLLKNLGLDSCILTSTDDYLPTAIHLANDLDFLRQTRATLRDRMSHSPIMDAKRYVQNLEAAYREMWKRRLASWMEG